MVGIYLFEWGGGGGDKYSGGGGWWWWWWRESMGFWGGRGREAESRCETLLAPG